MSPGTKSFTRLSWLAIGGFVCLLAAFALRFFALDSFPPGVQHDEVFIANFADTILRTRSIAELPIFFELNRGNEPLFMYLVAGAFKFFGENVWALRGTAALCGFLAIVLTFALAKDMFSSDLAAVNPKTGASELKESGEFVALITVVGLTFSFWLFYESREGLHAISTCLFAAATFYAFWRGWTRQKRGWMLASGVLAGLATYTYRSGIFVPVALLIIVAYTFIFHRAQWGKNALLAPLIFVIAGLIYFPLGYYILTHPDASLARLGDLSGDISELFKGNPLPLLGNAAGVLGMFGVQGDPEWRYNVAFRPVFDPLWAVLFYAGVAIAVWRFKRAPYALVLIWLVVMVMPSILSPNNPSQHRSVGAIGAAFILPALTLDEVRKWVLRRRGKETIEEGSDQASNRRSDILGIAFWVGVAGLVLLAAFGGINAYFNTWAQNPQLRLIQRADLAEAAKWLDANGQGERALISAEFANDLDRGSFNLESKNPNGPQFFHGGDTFVIPAQGGAIIANPRSGSIGSELAQEFLLGLTPVYERSLPEDVQELAIYHPTGEKVNQWRSEVPKGVVGTTADNQIKILGAEFPKKIESGGGARVRVWWQIDKPRVTDEDALAWNVAMVDDKNYDWSDAAGMGYTPSQWQTGDIVVSEFDLAIPTDAPPREYKLQLSLGGKNGALLFARPGSNERTGSLDVSSFRVTRGPVPEAKPELPIRYPSKAKFGNAIQLLGSDAIGEVAAGGTWRLILFWKASEKPPADYRLRIVAQTEDGKEIARDEEPLLGGVYPTSQWRVGDYVRSVHELTIPSEAPHGKAVVKVALLDKDNKPVGRTDGAPIAGIEISGRTHDFSKPNPETQTQKRFGDTIELIGYDVPVKSAAPRGKMDLKLYWHALGAALESYTVFVHLLDANGKVIGQKDAPPLNGEAPTDGWQKDEYIADTYGFDIAADAPAGAATLEVGLYDPGTGKRLTVIDENGAALGDHLVIPGLQITP